MNTMTENLVKDLYAIDDSEEMLWVHNYDPMINSFGEIIERLDLGSYQGDTIVLLKNDDLYGLLQFGWGSCSGCDALEGCENLKDLSELYTSLRDSINWTTKEEIVKYLKEHDWEGDYFWCLQSEDAEIGNFVAKSLNALENN
jgi:hypothetical protein